ncbi:MAG: penicillin acylase family protein [Chitinophagaceae bacterium]|nr:penicillin acylase family protein [Chitinophagaceae bacterium]
MRKIGLLLTAVLFFCIDSNGQQEIKKWEAQAKRVTIIRDQWGIPHIYGKSDADAVFGLLYAQCEDDFKRVELNYVEKLGRMAEVKGTAFIYEDLLIRMIIDTNDAKADFKKAPAWLKKLCYAYADGINYYLYKHPETKPALLTHFEPWYPFLWTDGSIGAINTADLGANDLHKLYEPGAVTALNTKAPDRDGFETDAMLTGSNGFAFSPKITSSGKSILYINPHVTFYFRPEVHMVSEEGLNAYGAVTWGQFFIYQGFNQNCGWMHTSCYVDAADTYIEKVNAGLNSYEYDGKSRPLTKKEIKISYTENGTLRSKTFSTLFTHHGPIMAKKNDQYYSLRADNRIYNGVLQCWLRTKADGLESFKKTLDLRGNISNNTVYADKNGNIAYWHGNRIPKRDPKYDWTKPVDGSTSATEWQGLHTIDETVHSINPSNGWLQNCNATPFTVAGNNSPKKSDYPVYMAPDPENFRGINAVRVLSEESNYDIDKVIKAGYDRRLSAFEILIPALVNRFETSINPSDSLYAYLVGPISVLKNWDYKSNVNSIATTLAIEWGQRMLPILYRTQVIDDEEADIISKSKYFAANGSANEMLGQLLITIKDLEKRFGRWQLPWGTINRFQRISSDIDNKFDDSKPSIPVGFVSSTWGMLPSYTSRTYPGTQKRYGVNGNSFICAVEFGDRIKAKSLLAGGESGDPNSPHFFDQAAMYAEGKFKDVLFYREDVLKNATKTYHPGE